MASTKLIRLCKLFSTFIIIKNVSEQQISMISEGSCDTNDAENSQE